MKTISPTSARKNIYSILSEIIFSPIRIHGKNGTGILISEEEWEDINATLELTSLPGMKESIIKGKHTPLSECSKSLDW